MNCFLTMTFIQWASWRRSLRGRDLGLTREPIRAIGGSSAPPLGMYVLPTVPEVGAVSRMQPWESGVLSRLSGRIYGRIPLRALGKPWDAGGSHGDLLVRRLPETSLPSKFPCSLKPHLPARGAGPLCVSPCPLRAGPVSDFSGSAPRLRSNRAWAKSVSVGLVHALFNWRTHNSIAS